MSALRLAVLSVVLTSVLGGYIPEHGLEHSVEPYAVPAHISIPPAISTFSFISLNPHKPTSYSGFTNHGRGHHDPGYAINFRQDGFAHHDDHHEVY